MNGCGTNAEIREEEGAGTVDRGPPARVTKSIIDSSCNTEPPKSPPYPKWTPARQDTFSPPAPGHGLPRERR